MTASFEFIREQRQDISHDAAFGEAIYVLEKVKCEDQQEWSPDAFMWGMKGRGVSGEDAKAMLQHLGVIGVVSIGENGSIQYPPAPHAKDEATQGIDVAASGNGRSDRTLWWIMDGPNNQ